MREGDGWQTHGVGGDAHIVPINDTITHEFADCICIPRVDPVKRDDGSMGWVIVHHSLDGREIRA